LPVGQGQDPVVPIDPGDRGAQAQFDLVVGGVVVAGQRECGAVPLSDIGTQSDAVVGAVGLLAENDDAPLVVLVPGAERLNEPVAHHSVADDDDGLVLGGCGCHLFLLGCALKPKVGIRCCARVAGEVAAT
jgi:hypothetical protein